jgi:hypothetical protein
MTAVEKGDSPIADTQQRVINTQKFLFFVYMALVHCSTVTLFGMILKDGIKRIQLNDIILGLYAHLVLAPFTLYIVFRAISWKNVQTMDRALNYFFTV